MSSDPTTNATDPDPLLSDPTSPVDPSNPILPVTTDPLIGEPAVPTTTGSPGMAVDCKRTLPCRWLSADTQFAVTVSNADNIGTTDRLTIEYSIVTYHDTKIFIASTASAIDDAGVRYEPAALSLGTGIGGSAQGVLAGATVPARIEFDRASSASTIEEWTIGLSDAGLVRQPKFTGIPIGPATSQHADCEYVLPCAWVSPAGDVTITLLSADGFGTTNRLSTNFKIETTKNTIVAIDSGATAVGIDGLMYTGRTHSMGIETGAQKITANSVAGAHVAASVFFARSQAMSSALQHLALVVYEDQPVPRWNPNFLSVPIQ